MPASVPNRITSGAGFIRVQLAMALRWMTPMCPSNFLGVEKSVNGRRSWEDTHSYQALSEPKPEVVDARLIVQKLQSAPAVDDGARSVMPLLRVHCAREMASNSGQAVARTTTSDSSMHSTAFAAKRTFSGKRARRLCAVCRIKGQHLHATAGEFLGQQKTGSFFDDIGTGFVGESEDAGGALGSLLDQVREPLRSAND